MQLCEQMDFYYRLYTHYWRNRKRKLQVNISGKIPKILHYCWFGTRGGDNYPPLIKKCMASWQKILPEYQVMFWNEKNFPFEDFIFAQGAYEAKRYEYVSDVVRLWALQKYGGIYVDTDVEVLRPLDEFLEHGFFSGFESSHRIPTGLMGAKKGHPYISLLLDWYHERRFTKYDENPNTRIISKITALNYHCKLHDDNTLLQLPGDVCFYPEEYFLPRGHIGKNAYCIHYIAGCGFDTTGKHF